MVKNNITKPNMDFGGLYKRKPIYKNLQRKIVFTILLVALIPLIFLGETIYYQFAKVYKEKIEDQIKYQAGSQSDALEIFLKERSAILSGIADTHRLEYLKQHANLMSIFNAISRRTNGFIDLGIIDSNGQHIAYAGPYSLEGLNLSNEELKTIFALPFFILLGEDDIIQDSYFLMNDAAMKQGSNRFERGKKFYSIAQREAQVLDTELNWQLITIPGCGHHPNHDMVSKIASLILTE